MKKNYFFIVLVVLSLMGCSENESDEVLLLSSALVEDENHFDAAMQLSESDRIVDAETLFLDKVKSSIKAGDMVAFKSLYCLKDANPEYVPMIDYIFNRKWTENFSDLSFNVEVNQKAKDNNIYFTTPYLGDLVIQSVSGQGTGTTKIPIGIKDGDYYFTIGSEQ